MSDKQAKAPSLRFQGFTDDWEQRKLGEIVEWTKGNKLKKEQLNEEGVGTEIVHYADLYKFNPVEDGVIHWAVIDEGTLIPDNSLLFPMSDVTPIGLARTSTINKSGIKAGGDTLIGTINILNLAQFLSYEINAHSKNILPLVTGTTVRHISSNSLDTLNITLPSYKEQESIVEIFNNIYHLIALHQRKPNMSKRAFS